MSEWVEWDDELGFWVECDSPDDDVDPAPCRDCGVDTHGGEFYMVSDELWETAVPEDAAAQSMTVFLCVGCLEKRLGRTLAARDFTNVPLNNPAVFRHSARLLDRLTGGTS